MAGMMFTIVFMSLLVTSVVAQNRLDPTIYTMDEYGEKYNAIQLVRGGIISAAIAPSGEESICNAFGQVAEYLELNEVISDGGLTVNRGAHKKVFDYIVTTNGEDKEEIVNGIKTFTVRKNINVEFGEDFLLCKSRYEFYEVNDIERYRSSVQGNIGFSNIQSKQIKIVDYGGVIDTQHGLLMFIVLGIRIPDIQ